MRQPLAWRRASHKPTSAQTKAMPAPTNASEAARRAIGPVKKTWVASVSACTVKSMRAKTLRPLVLVRKRFRDEPQLLEVQECRRGGEQQHECAEREQVGRAQHQRDAGKRVAADRPFGAARGRNGATEHAGTIRLVACGRHGGKRRGGLQYDFGRAGTTRVRGAAQLLLLLLLHCEIAMV